MFSKTLFLFLIAISGTILILSSFIHPEIITEQFGVISRERTCIYDHLILLSMLLILISIIGFNIYSK